MSAKAKSQSKLPINLEDLLRQRHVKGERIEYKAGWNPDATVRTLCADANDFQNLGGGYVIIGLQSGQAVSRRYRNRRIAEFLKELDLTEGRSTGIHKILKVMKANGSPEPQFETDEKRSYFITRLPVHPQAVREDGRQDSTPHDADQGEAPTPQITPQATPQVARLLSVLRGELERDRLQTLLGLADRKYFRKAYLNPALEAGVIEMTIPDRPNSMNQKYRLTATGKRWLKEQDQ